MIQPLIFLLLLQLCLIGPVTKSRAFLPQPACFEKAPGSLKAPGNCRFFSIVFDAGSTGTRIHVFMFTYETESPHYLHLVNEAFLKTEPGLSSFRNDSNKAAEQIRSLLRFADKVDPLVASRILKAVEDELLFSGYNVTAAPVAEIMSGQDEGLHGWASMNYLLGLLEPAWDPAIAAAPGASLDLGGASTQISFNPTSPLNASLLLHPTIWDHPPLTLYTQSYLGNGMRRARLAIMRALPSTKAAEADVRFLSPCVPPGFVFDWSLDDRVYNASGSEDYGLAACHDVVRKVISASHIHAPAELRDRTVYAFSHYYKIPHKIGLVGKEGGVITVQQLYKSAVDACKRSSDEVEMNKWSPWRCLDLLYTYTMLHEAYDLPEDKAITLLNKLNGRRVSWALSKGHDLLSSYLDITQMQ